MSIFPLSLTLLFVVSLLDNARHSEGIISGQVADHRDYPYLVSLRNESGHYCGGALVTRKHVLTTAYCMYVDETIYLGKSSEMYKAEDIKAVVDTSCEDLSACTYQAAALTPHPLYEIRKLDRVLYDIGIVTLEKIVENENVITLKIANYFPRGRDIGTVVGWGTADRELIPLRYPSDTLHKLDVRVLDSDFCRSLFESSLDRWIISDLRRKTILCGKTKIGMGTSFRDNGSPLVKNNELLGLVTSRFTYSVEIFVSAREHLDWINYRVSRDSIDQSCNLSTNKLCRMKKKSYLLTFCLVLAIILFAYSVVLLNFRLSNLKFFK